MAQHGTVPDYHTSGSWGSVTAAAACARLMKLLRRKPATLLVSQNTRDPVATGCVVLIILRCRKMGLAGAHDRSVISKRGKKGFTEPRNYCKRGSHLLV